MCLFIGNGEKRQNDYVLVGAKGGNKIQFNNTLYFFTSRTNMRKFYIFKIKISGREIKLAKKKHFSVSFFHAPIKSLQYYQGPR